jgi:hypothetical protein
MWTRHHLLLGVLLLGNALLFAGVDAIVRLATTVVVLVLMLDLRQIPELPRVHRWVGWGFGALALVQLLPLPLGFREFLQPGFVGLARPGWAPLSVAPWATVQVAASVVVMAGVALVAARMASTRTGLPALLATLALCCGLLGVLGLAGEAGAPDKVLLVRANTGGGDVYGPFVNSNHFAAAIELSLPAAMVLLAVGLRHILERRSTRQRSMVVSLAAAVSCAIGCAAMLRSGSRGGLLFLVLAAIATLPLWWRGRFARNSASCWCSRESRATPGGTSGRARCGCGGGRRCSVAASAATATRLDWTSRPPERGCSSRPTTTGWNGSPPEASWAPRCWRRLSRR